MNFLRYLFLVVVSLGLSSALRPTAAQDNVAEWTFLVYMAAENNLEAAAINDLIEMQHIGSTEAVNIVVQTDRSPDYDTRSGNWNDTRRFYMTRQPEFVPPAPEVMLAEIRALDELNPNLLAPEDAAAVQNYLDYLETATPEEIEAEYTYYGLGEDFTVEPLELLGETNTGDPTYFKSFLDWGITNYPAKQYALIIWNHGGGWSGIGPDDGSYPGILSLPEIDRVLGQVRQEHGIEKFDLIGFDACLMGQLEVYQTLSPHARYATAAQELVPGDGYNYDAALQALIDNPAMTPEEFGTVIVDTFNEFYETVVLDSSTDLHLLNLGEMEDVTTSLSAFTQLAQQDPVAVMNAIGLARNSSRVFGAQDPVSADYFSSVDLRTFMSLFTGMEVSSELVTAAQTVVDAIDQAVVYSQLGASSINANGIAIYFPFNTNVYAVGGNRNLYPNGVSEQMSPWIEFFTDFHQTTNETLDPSKLLLDVYDVITIGETPSLNTPPTVLFSTEGAGVISMRVNAIYEDEILGRVVVAETPITFSYLDEAGQFITSFPSEYSENTYTWDGLIPAVYQDEFYTPILLRYTPDFLTATVRGEYIWGDGSWTVANLVFDTASGNLISAWSIIETEEGTTTSQISISQGDAFYPYYEILGANGKLTPITNENYYILLGGVPVYFEFIPAYTGNYTLRIEQEDMAGNTTADTFDITVNNDTARLDGRGFVELNDGISFLFPTYWSDSTVQAFDDETFRYVLNAPGFPEHIIFEPRYDLTNLEDLLAKAQESLADRSATVNDPQEAKIGGYPAYILPYEYDDPESKVHYYGQLAVFFSDLPNTGGYWLDVYTDNPETLAYLTDMVFTSVQVFEPVDITKPQP